MTTPNGEMPFLDHLEELRGRLFRILAAAVIGIGVGLWLSFYFNVVDVLKGPAAKFLPGGKLTVHSPTEALMTQMQLGLVAGLILASPVIIQQLWGFLSPALTGREKRIILPALVAGLLFFMLGAWFSWEYLVPISLKVLIEVAEQSYIIQFTFREYIGFLLAMVLGVGVVFELPLVMIILSGVGLVEPKRWHTFRRHAIVLAMVVGAIVSPGPDPFLMLLFTLPVLLLYEFGVAGSYLVRRRKKLGGAAAAAMVLFALLATPGTASAQDPPRTTRTDSLGRPPGTRAVDTATARRLGLPAGPIRKFPEPDSLMQALLAREGFAVTRYVGDSARLRADSSAIELQGRAATDRDRSILEAERITYDGSTGRVTFSGEPRMFEGAQVSIMRDGSLDTESGRAVLRDAFTTFDDQGARWYMRGTLAVDSSAKRLFASGSEFTTCDLPTAHYHFWAGEMKWVSQDVLVARPAVLYIRDVPIMWLPFIFQDMRGGRRSGILVPQFGINDIVRPTRTYSRQITNVGYYWAPNDYLDVTARFDWYASRYIQYGLDFRYKWLDRFVGGGISLDRQRQSDGSSSTDFRWVHRQEFSVATSLNLDINYVGNSRVLAGNAIDPLVSTQQISSAVNFQKRLPWGRLTIGGQRRQSITDGSGTMTLPSLTLTTEGTTFGAVTWTPSVTVTNATQFKVPQRLLIADGGVLDTLETLGRSRQSRIGINSPFLVGSFTLPLTIDVTDQQSVARSLTTRRVPDLSTPDPDDSVSVTTVRGGAYQSGVDFGASFQLPPLFRSTWNIQPEIGFTNIAAGVPFFLRTPGSGGDWVRQGKRFEFQLRVNPQFYGFLRKPIGPMQAFRYGVQPLITMSWSPEARLSDAFVRAMASNNLGGGRTDVPAAMMASVGLNQEWMGKPRRAAGDSAGSEPQPISLLRLTTSALQYDFEQAKEPGRTGWRTQTVTNAFQSSLVQGFQLSMTHDLWEGQVGTDSARFKPFLSAVQANLALTGRTFRSLGSLFGLGRGPGADKTPPGQVPYTPPPGGTGRRFRPGQVTNPAFASGGGLTANLTYSLTRQRPNGAAAVIPPIDPDDPFGGIPIPLPTAPGSQSSIGLSTSFSPTTFWKVSWQTQYNATAGRFESQMLQLERDLHDWTASFNFVKSANGNYALYFSVFLRSMSAIKFDYNQTTLQP